MEEDRPMIHIRLPKALVRRIDHVSVDLDIDRARTIERILERGLAEFENSGQLVASAR
jgi:metal-responsive CopG/Arc/MetJ family transcriptional regulator